MSSPEDTFILLHNIRIIAIGPVTLVIPKVLPETEINPLGITLLVDHGIGDGTCQDLVLILVSAPSNSFESISAV